MHLHLLKILIGPLQQIIKWPKITYSTLVLQNGMLTNKISELDFSFNMKLVDLFLNFLTPICMPHLDNRGQSYVLHGERWSEHIKNEKINLIITLTLQSDPRYRNLLKNIILRIKSSQNVKMHVWF